MPRVAALLCASLLCACSFPAPPTLLPPPFGPDRNNPEPARLFFPTGIAIDRTSSWVMVSNSNADRLYDAGATYSLPAAQLLQYFHPLPPGTQPPKVPFPATALAGKVITGNYTGPMILAGGTSPGDGPLTAYMGSRDTNRLNVVALDGTTGLLTCRGASGTDDCRGASIDLNRDAQVEGPFGIAAASVRSPVTGADVGAILVSSLVPHVEEIQSGAVFTSSRLAGLAQGDLSLLFSATVTDRLNGSGFGGGPLVFDDRAREAIVAGCFTRFGAASAGGELSTLKCATVAGGSNLLRFVPVDAGSSAHTRLYDLGSQINSSDTTGLTLGAVDPVTGVRRLYMVTRFADTLVRVGLQADPSFVPVVESVMPLAGQPSQVITLERPAGSTGPELLAITLVSIYETSTTAGKLVVVDGLRGRVLAQVDRLGDTPFAIAQFKPAPGDTSAKLAITLFGGCSIALVDVPYDDPRTASLRANVGSCP